MTRQITVKPYQRTFRSPLRTARGQWTHREGFLIRVEDSGQVGYGEVAPLPEFGTETVAAAADFLGALADQPELEVPADLPCCQFGISTASHAISEEGQPLCRPQGVDKLRTTQRLSLLRDYAVSALLPAGSAALRMAEAKLAAGYHSLKWKVGLEPVAKELDQVRSLLESLPEGARLRLDANASLTIVELEVWLELLRQFPQQVDYLEQPLACGEEVIMAEAMAASDVPIALDESLNGPAGVHFLKAGAWSGPLVIKAPLMGDCEPLLVKLATVADQVVLSSVFETGIGLQNVLVLADSLPGLRRPIGFDTLDAFDDALTPMKSASNIRAEDRSCYTAEEIWNLI